jgi:hypothetical protein
MHAQDMYFARFTFQGAAGGAIFLGGGSHSGGGGRQSMHLAEIRGSIAFGRGGNIAGSLLEESLERGGKGTCSSVKEWLDAGMLTYADIC